MDDPYGQDFQGKAYIQSFLRGAYQTEVTLPKILPPNHPPHLAYLYVDAIDPLDGKRYRYTGRIEEPTLTNKTYLKGHKRFVVERTLAVGPIPRYGVTYEDISTASDRDHWIAGSSLKVIDLVNNEMIAERIGYLYDVAQGNTDGGSQPWLRAVNHSCPSFGKIQAAASQSYQTEIFVEKTLLPGIK